MRTVSEALSGRLVPSGTWLSTAEQEQVVAALLHHGLLKFSNARDLPLKSGGTTDIYINLRDARNSPEAIRLIAELFANPLRRLRASRFAEIPDAVSCFAGPLSVDLNIPMVTIREEAKGGRVTKGKLIGTMHHGENVVMIDDVITDGASKLVPYYECLARGVNPTLVVLVDRQQGWKQVFDKGSVRMPVWAGMTLHDVRRFLISGFGVMERSKPELEVANPIIVALDGKSWEEILPVVDKLRTSGCIFKINDLLHEQSMTDVVQQLSVYGRVMVDFKAHDIPNTVANTAARYREAAPWAVTVHGSGGEGMVKAAVRAFDDTPTKVLVVTVLTSIDEKTCEEIYHSRPIDEVRTLARIGAEAGARGFVCSAQEVEELHNLYPNAELVVPGVRSHGADTNDQARVDTPAAAIAKGATHLVMGRQVLGAMDPAAEVLRVMKEELNISVV